MSNSVFGNSLSDILDFLSGLQLSATGEYIWSSDYPDGMSLVERQAALEALRTTLASTAWQVTTSPTALLPMTQSKQFLVDGSTLYLTRDAWLSLQAQIQTVLTDADKITLALYLSAFGQAQETAGNGQYSGVMQVRSSDATTMTGLKTMLVSKGWASNEDFVTRASGAAALTAPVSGVALRQAMATASGQETVLLETVGSQVTMRLSATLAQSLITAAQSAAAAKLQEAASIAWVLRQAMVATTPIRDTQGRIKVNLSWARLQARLAPIMGTLLPTPSTDKTSTTAEVVQDDANACVWVQPDTLTTLVTQSRQDILDGLAELVRAQCAQVTRSDSTQLIDTSAWLGSLLFNAQGQATDLQQLLTLEGVSLRQSTTALSSTPAIAERVGISGALLVAGGRTQATLETLQAWAADLARGGSYTKRDTSLGEVDLRIPQPVILLTSAQRSALTALQTTTIPDGLSVLETFLVRTNATVIQGDPAQTYWDTGIAVSTQASNADLAKIESATQTVRANWDWVNSNTSTPTVLIPQGELLSLQLQARYYQDWVKAQLLIDDLAQRRSSNAKPSDTTLSDWVILADNEISGNDLMNGLRSLIPAYQPIAQSSIATATFGMPVWITEGGAKKLVAKADTINHWLAQMQVQEEMSESLFLHEVLDAQRPDNDTTAIDLGEWKTDGTGAGNKFFAQLQASAALVSPPEAVTAFDASSDGLGKAQLVTVNGVQRLQINRDTLDTWSLQLAYNAAMLNEIQSGEVGSWGATYAALTQLRGGKIDLTRARLAYTVSTIGRNVIWIKKDISLERSYQLKTLVIDPMFKSLNTALDQVDFTIKTAVASKQSGMITKEDLQWILEELLSSRNNNTRGTGGALTEFVAEMHTLLDNFGLNDANTQVLRTQLNKLEDDLRNSFVDTTTLQSSDNRRARFSGRSITNLFFGKIQRFTNSALNTLTGMKSALNTQTTNLSEAFVRKIGFYESTKEGMQLDRFIGGVIGLGWSFASYALVNKAVRDGEDPLNTAYLAFTGMQLTAQTAHMLVWFGSGILDTQANNRHLIRRNDEFLRRAFREAFNGKNVWDAYAVVREVKNINVNQLNRLTLTGGTVLVRTEMVGGQPMAVTYRYTRTNSVGRYVFTPTTQGTGLPSIKLESEIVQRWLKLSDEQRQSINFGDFETAWNNREQIAAAVGDLDANGQRPTLSDAGIKELIKDQLNYNYLPQDQKDIVDGVGRNAKGAVICDPNGKPIIRNLVNGQSLMDRLVALVQQPKTAVLTQQQITDLTTVRGFKMGGELLDLQESPKLQAVSVFEQLDKANRNPTLGLTMADGLDIQYNDSLTRLKDYVGAKAWTAAGKLSTNGQSRNFNGNIEDVVKLKSAYTEVNNITSEVKAAFKQVDTKRPKLTPTLKQARQKIRPPKLASHRNATIGATGTKTYDAPYPWREEALKQTDTVPKRARLAGANEKWWGVARYGSMLAADVLGIVAPALGIAYSVQAKAQGGDAAALDAEIVKQSLFLIGNVMLLGGHGVIAFTKPPAPGMTSPFRAFHQGLGVTLSVAANFVMLINEVANLNYYRTRLAQNKTDRDKDPRILPDQEAGFAIAGSSLNILFGALAAGLSVAIPVAGLVVGLLPLVLPNFGEIGRGHDLEAQALALRKMGRDHEADLIMTMGAAAYRSAVPFYGWGGPLITEQLVKWIFSQSNDASNLLNKPGAGLVGQTGNQALTNAINRADGGGEWIWEVDASKPNGNWMHAYTNFGIPDFVLPLNGYAAQADGVQSWSFGVEDWKRINSASARLMLARLQGQANGTQDWFQEAFKERTLQAVITYTDTIEVAQQQVSMYQEMIHTWNAQMAKWRPRLKSDNLPSVWDSLDSIPDYGGHDYQGQFVSWDTVDPSSELATSISQILRHPDYSSFLKAMYLKSLDKVNTFKAALADAVANLAEQKALENAHHRNFQSEIDRVLLPKLQAATQVTDTFLITSRSEVFTYGTNIRKATGTYSVLSAGVKNEERVDASVALHLSRPTNDDWTDILAPQAPASTASQAWDTYKAQMEARYARVQNKLDASGNPTSEIRYAISDTLDKVGFSLNYRFSGNQPNIVAERWVFTKDDLKSRPSDVSGREVAFTVRDDGGNIDRGLLIDATAIDDQRQSYSIERKNVEIRSGAQDDVFFLSTTEGVRIDGGAGEDVVMLDTAIAQTADMDAFRNIERLIGTSASDTITANGDMDYEYQWQYGTEDGKVNADTVDFSAATGSATVMIGAGSVRTGSNVDAIVVMAAPNATLNIDTGADDDLLTFSYLDQVQITRDMTTGQYNFNSSGLQQSGTFKNVESVVGTAGADAITLSGGINELLSGDGNDVITVGDNTQPGLVNAGAVLVDAGMGDDDITVNSADHTRLILNQGLDKVKVTASARLVDIGVGVELGQQENADTTNVKEIDLQDMDSSATVMVDVDNSERVKIFAGRGKLIINLLDSSARVELFDNANRGTNDTIQINYLPDVALDDRALRNDIRGTAVTNPGVLSGVTQSSNISGFRLGDAITYHASSDLSSASVGLNNLSGPTRYSRNWQGLNLNLTDLNGQASTLDGTSLWQQAHDNLPAISDPGTAAYSHWNNRFNVYFRDLQPGTYGILEGTNLVFDRDGGGFGWYREPNPLQRGEAIDPSTGYRWNLALSQGGGSEFVATNNPNVWQARVGGLAEGKIDFLTVFWHEYAHRLGWAHSSDPNDFMYDNIQPGVRRLPTPSQQLQMLQSSNAKWGTVPTLGSFDKAGNMTGVALLSGIMNYAQSTGEAMLPTARPLDNLSRGWDGIDQQIDLSTNQIAGAYTAAQLATKRAAIAAQRDEATAAPMNTVTSGLNVLYAELQTEFAKSVAWAQRTDVQQQIEQYRTLLARPASSLTAQEQAQLSAARQNVDFFDRIQIADAVNQARLRLNPSIIPQVDVDLLPVDRNLSLAQMPSFISAMRQEQQHLRFAYSPGDVLERGQIDTLRLAGLSEAQLSQVLTSLDNAVFRDPISNDRFYVTKTTLRNLITAAQNYLILNPSANTIQTLPGYYEYDAAGNARYVDGERTGIPLVIATLQSMLNNAPVNDVMVQLKGEGSGAVSGVLPGGSGWTYVNGQPVPAPIGAVDSMRIFEGLVGKLNTALGQTLLQPRLGGIVVDITYPNDALLNPVTTVNIEKQYLPEFQFYNNSLWPNYGSGFFMAPGGNVRSGAASPYGADTLWYDPEQGVYAANWNDFGRWQAALVNAQQGIQAYIDTFNARIASLKAYSLSLADGSPLPDYLVFDSTTMQLQVKGETPPNLMLQLTAYNDAGTVSLPFMLTQTVFAGTTQNGTSGDDSFDVHTGASLMAGGLGNDTYNVNDNGDVVIESANAGDDTIQSSLSYTLGANLENLILTGTAALNGTGNTLNNELTGNIANNILDGGAGLDTLIGGAGLDTLLGGVGDDTYVVDNAGDVVTENLNEGTDTVQSSVSYTLGANLENLTLTGTAALNGTGNTLNNVITGNSGNNLLDGGAGIDTLIGGTGNDTYVIDSNTDVLSENLNEGTDTVQSSVSYILGNNLENLTLTGTAALNGTGNNLNNVLRGNNRNNMLDGGAGTDTVVLSGVPADYSFISYNGTLAVGDRIANRDGLDQLRNVEQIQFLGNGQTLSLSALPIKSAMEYIASYTDLRAAFGTNDAAGYNHYLTYGYNEGRMVTFDGLQYIASNSDLMSFFGGDAVGGARHAIQYNYPTVTSGHSTDNTLQIQVGGTGDDSLAGTTANDGIFGQGGNDSLLGSSGSDGISGGNGNDTLDGGIGADRLAGGAGDDTYLVDNSGDIVDERYNSGVDTVISSIDFNLGGPQVFGALENLTLTGTSAINGTGNSLNNVMTGNSGNNVLDGGAGNDTLIGGAGNDLYYLDQKFADKVQEVMNASGGVDTVVLDSATLATQGGYSLQGWNASNPEGTAGQGIENLFLSNRVNANFNLHGNTLNNVLWGNDYSGALQGYAGNDILYGASGTDTLDGGTGNDTYFFDRRSGADTVIENDSTSGNRDTLYIDARSDQLWFRRIGNDLVIDIMGSQDAIGNNPTNKITIQNHYLGGAYQVERIVSNDGKALSAANANALVQALSGQLETSGATSFNDGLMLIQKSAWQPVANSVWVSSQVTGLVSAMAAFAPPAAGTTLSATDYQNRAATILAANVQA